MMLKFFSKPVGWLVAGLIVALLALGTYHLLMARPKAEAKLARNQADCQFAPILNSEHVRRPQGRAGVPCANTATDELALRHARLA